MNLECLFAYAFLWAWGFCSMQEYNVHLDRMFSETPNNKILLELEESSNNNGLEIVYKSNVYTIAEFGKICYQLWKLLPEFLVQEQPFWTLSYADDPLSWGDEKQSRIIYEEAFRFYKG